MLIDWQLMDIKYSTAEIQKMKKRLVVKNAQDSQKAFENAKSKGLDKPQDFMYMYSQDGHDFFKNIMFRNYINFVQ